MDLGLVLLDCMEGQIQPSEQRSISFIQEQRALNRVFNLSSPERWSGCKQLIDFLDELFHANKLAAAKMERPVRNNMIPPLHQLHMLIQD